MVKTNALERRYDLITCLYYREYLVDKFYNIIGLPVSSFRTGDWKE